MDPKVLAEKSDSRAGRRAVPHDEAEALVSGMDDATEAFRRKEGKARVAAALVLIEKAQRAINLAQEKLSPVLGFSEEWTDTGKLYDTIKAHWSAVNARLSEMIRAGNGPRVDDFTVEYERPKLEEKLSSTSEGQESQP